MASIEKADMEREVVDRLNAILQDTAGAKYNATAALAALTTLVCWVVQRARRSNEPKAQRLWQVWQKTDAAAEPWILPGVLGKLKVSEALQQLRDALAHADDATASPVNGAVEPYRNPQLVGFMVTAKAGEVTLMEDELRRIGAVLAGEYLPALAK